MIIAKLMSWFEHIGTSRAAAELHRMGYHTAANNLLKK
jgi:hypothetical protein